MFEKGENRDCATWAGDGPESREDDRSNSTRRSFPAYGAPMPDLLSTLETKLREAFTPSYLAVEDESHKHAGHGGATEHAEAFGATAPSHVHIAIRADAFSALSRLARHRAVMDAIADEVAQLHALRLTIEG